MQKAFYNLITKTAAMLVVLLIGAAPSLAQVTVSIGDATGREGESVSIPVRISGVGSGTAIESFQFTVSNDAGITFTGHSVAGTLAGAAGFATGSNPSNGKVGGNSLGTNITGDGTLVFLNFDLDSESSGTITLTPDPTGFFNGGPPAVVGSLTANFTVANRIMAVEPGPISSLVISQDFEIVISLEDALLDSDDAISFGFDLNYDPSLMSIRTAAGVNGVIASGVTSGESVNGAMLDSDTYRIGGYTGTEFTGDGEFIRIAATASSVNHGVGTISLTNIEFNAPGDPPFYAGKSAFIGVSLDTANEDDPSLPSDFSLKGNYPNPFNPSTTIQFNLPETADVQVQVSDLLGRQVMSIPSRTVQAGTNRSIQINASSLASGIYVYRVIARGAGQTYIRSNMMTLIK